MDQQRNRGGKPDGGDERGERPLIVYPASRFIGEPPPRKFIDGFGFFPEGELSYLSGAGAVGKTLLGLQLCCAVALERWQCDREPLWLGRPVLHDLGGRVAFISAEEEGDELHRRVADISAAEMFDPKHLYNLTILDLVSEDDPALFVENRQRGTVIGTKTFQRVERELHKLPGLELLMIDNRVQIARVNSIDGNTGVMVGNMLRRLGRSLRCTTIVLSHPSQAGLNSGTGTSGALTWTNTGRGHVFMHKPKNRDQDIDFDIDDDDGRDDGKRQLLNQKANYSRMGTTVNLRWEMGRYVCTDQPPRAGSDIGAAGKAERVFLHLLRVHNDLGSNVSANSTANNFAPKKFYPHPDNENVSIKALTAAMHALIKAGKIAAVPYGPPSAGTRRLEVI